MLRSETPDPGEGHEFDPTPLSAVAPQATPTDATSAHPGPTATAGKTITIHVIGTPVAQGSKVANSFGHGVRDANTATLKPWRSEVAGCVSHAMATAGWVTLDEPVEVTITFYHQRLTGHYGTGRNAGVLKATAPRWKSTAPDIDKLTRAVLDSLTTSRVIRDDARVARLVVEDLYADAATGARITISALHSGPVDVSPLESAGRGTAPHPIPHAGCGATTTPETPGDPLEGEASGHRDTTIQEALL